MSELDGSRRSRPDADRFERVVTSVLLKTASLHPDEVGAVIVEAAGALGAWDVDVLLIDLDQRVLRPFAWNNDGIEAPVEDTAAGTAYRDQHVIDGGAVEGGRRLWVPIVDSAERVGVLGISVAEPAEQVLERFCALASLFGEIIMEKSSYGDSIVRRRRSKQMTLAAELRWALLPPLTFASPQIDISGILEPAYEIAGDTFDYAVDADVAHVAILDAMGHGLTASRIANLAVSSYRNSRRAREGLVAMFVEMDRVVATEIGDQSFVTGQLATIRLDDGVLQMLNAGHPLPLHFRAKADLGDVPCTPSLPLGLGSTPTVRAELTLEPGDVVVFYTDGITEARDAIGHLYGRERLVETILAAMQAEALPPEILRVVVRDLLDFQGGRNRDDASLILVSWKPERRARVTSLGGRPEGRGHPDR
jgi:Stage II sporulation protein E (SpoIIE)